MTPALQLRHARLLLAAITVEANSDRLPDKQLREYIIDLTSSLDLPEAKHA